MKKLPLQSRHESLGAKFGEFAGFSMPLYYSKPIDEHNRVREGGGVFDISHMGQFLLTGDRAAEMLQYALPPDVAAMADGQALYAPLCREDGGVLDDLILYRHDANRFRAIVNAGRRELDFRWLEGIASEFGVSLEDLSDQYCLFAVQGPEVFAKLAPHVDHRPGAMAYYTFTETRAFGEEVFLARTGYTGEPGCEIAVPVARAEAVWAQLVDDLGVPPIGLAARDSLRLEAAFPLYGAELREEWHALESGLEWTIDLDGEQDYIGKKALMAIQGVGFPYRLVGLEMTGQGIPREGYPILNQGEEVGRVTSGTLSPTTGKAIAMGRVRIPSHKVGTPLQVRIRDNTVDAVVGRRPFYQNPTLRAREGDAEPKKRYRIFT